MEEESVFCNPAMRLHVAGIVYLWYSAAHNRKSRRRRPGLGGLMESAEEEPQDNLARLKSHLKAGSLAERLVSARIDAGASDPRPNIRKVLTDRIEELRRAHDVPDQQA
jgi:hypothetical protein